MAGDLGHDPRTKLSESFVIANFTNPHGVCDEKLSKSRTIIVVRMTRFELARG